MLILARTYQLETMPDHANRLINETSPYLLQHAHNPVDWYPWGEEAFAKARAEDKPIFLSIGYSACHWCHVMERECFENETIAALMNRLFVNIKVDREVRPDLDDLYMTFVQMTTGSGGWPMSVWLTPDGQPFFGGTYFPPEDAHGRRGFPAILHAVADAWRTERDQIIAGSEEVVAQLKTASALPAGAAKLNATTIATAVHQLLERFDPVEGGFGNAPKFPPSFALSLMLRRYRLESEPRLLRAVMLTLDKMARGGIYDHLGGGFHRYSVDNLWLVPHFEKMLYDNALLAVAYADAWQVTHEDRYRVVVTEILDYVLRDLADPAGGFHSAEDADSDGEEGKFYVWTESEIMAVLGAVDGRLFCDYYGVDPRGNFEHQRSVLNVRVKPDEFAARYNYSAASLTEHLGKLRRRLLAHRDRRNRPFKDDKVLTEWNGLMLSALARGSRITDDPRFLQAARRCAAFIEQTMLTPTGLMRVYRNGVVQQPGFLTDYAFVAAGLIDLYEASFEIRWLHLADRLVNEMIARFSDPVDGGFFMTSAGHTDILLRQKDSYDGATPSGNSVATMTLLRLAAFTGKEEYCKLAEDTIAALSGNAARVPTAYLNLLNAVDFAAGPIQQIAIVGPLRNSDIQMLLGALNRRSIPNVVVALFDPETVAADPAADPRELIPFLRDRVMQNNRPTAYVCENSVCQLPALTPEDLTAQLGV